MGERVAINICKYYKYCTALQDYVVVVALQNYINQSNNFSLFIEIPPSRNEKKHPLDLNKTANILDRILGQRVSAGLMLRYLDKYIYIL